MDELPEALSSILNDPEMMAQVKAMAQSLGLDPGMLPVGQESAAESSPPESREGIGSPGLKSLLGAVQAAGGSDRQTALLNALKPYTHGQRREKLEKAFQVASLVKLARAARDTGGK